MRGNGLILNLGRTTIGKVESYRAMVSLFYDTIVAFLKGKGRSVPRKQLVNQILFIGVDALVINLVIGLLAGIIISYVSFENMDNIGASSQFGLLMVYSILCEMSPLLTAVVVVGRSGSALTTFLGNMKVCREIDALESMAIDVVEYLVLPAFLGMIVSLIALNFYFDFVALLGGVFFAKITKGISFVIYSSQIMDALVWSDIPFAVMKSILYGAVIAVVSSYHGLVVTSFRIVPRAVYRSVVTSITAILLLNLPLSVVYYVIRSTLGGY